MAVQVVDEFVGGFWAPFVRVSKEGEEENLRNRWRTQPCPATASAYIMPENKSWPTPRSIPSAKPIALATTTGSKPSSPAFVTNFIPRLRLSLKHHCCASAY